MSALGKVLLFKGGDWISWVVKWQSRSIYSHAALLIPGTLTCIESYPGVGVRKRELTAEDFGRADIYDVEGMTPEMWQVAIEFAEKQLARSVPVYGQSASTGEPALLLQRAGPQSRCRGWRALA